jgi:ABC-2 type transport system permease protein
VLRVAWLITSLEARRWYNRRPALQRRTSGPRSGTQQKRAPAKLLLLGVSLILAFNAATQLTHIIHGVAYRAEQDADPRRVPVDAATLRRLREHEEALRRGPPTPGQLEAPHWELALDVRDDMEVQPEQRDARVDMLVRRYREQGLSGFRARTLLREVFLPTAGNWYGAADSPAMLMPLGLLTFLLALGVLFVSAVGMERDLARTESSLEWWFTFPVSARGLLLARVLGAALINPLAWLFLLPLFATVFVCAGLSLWLALLLAVLATLYIGLLAGSLRVLLETVLRALLPLRRVAHVQAALELLGAVPMVLGFAATSRAGLASLIEHARMLPTRLLYNPLSLPLGWLRPGQAAWLCGLACFAVALLSVLGAVSIGSHMLRDGLLRSTGPLQGARRRVVSASGGTLPLSRVVARQELLSIVRDPGRLARVVVFPIAMIAINGLMNPGFFRAIVTSADHASAAAFGLSTLVLASGGLFTLANEGAGLWLFYTTPHAFERVLLQKGVFWSALAVLCTALSLGALAAITQRPLIVLSPQALLALVGAALYGFIAVALGTLGTDVLESERPRRMQPFTPQLFMLLSSLFAFALYVPSAWAKFAQLSISALFVFALWQKVRDHTPYILDPTEAPPPRIAVADGIFAALAFFVLQGLLGFSFHRLHLADGLSLLFAFVGAGVLVTVSSLYLFRRLGIPDLRGALGLSLVGTRPLRALLAGVLTGLAAGSVALAYTVALEQVPWLRELREQGEQLDANKELLPWIGALAVLAAPLFEELIFRGILYRGFRRSLAPLHAALASALVFALVHPPLAFVPVFVMALLAALVFERTGLLLAPIAAHATYNALVVGAALFAQQP